MSENLENITNTEENIVENTDVESLQSPQPFLFKI